tara:strand:- start:497 stop:850 length:354 start_codon:yes stop_codon:yes gene_type:complete
MDAATSGIARRHHFARRPSTLVEAVMNAAPGAPFEESLEEQDLIRDQVADALDALDADDAWIFHMIANVGLSIRFVGTVMGIPKSTLHRRYHRIRRDLAADLLRHPEIQERLGFIEV